MYKVKYYNEISKEAKNELTEHGVTPGQGGEMNVVVVRSHKLHENTDINKSLIVARAGIGTGNIPCDRLKKELIPVAFAPGGNADSVVETTICKVLSGAKNQNEAIAFVKNSQMEPKDFEKFKKQFKGDEIKGKIIVIIGLGMVGARLAYHCAALGMKVIGKDLKNDMGFLRNVLGRNNAGKTLLCSIEKNDGKVVVKDKVCDLKNGQILITSDWEGAVKYADFMTIHCGYWGKPVFDGQFFQDCKRGLVIINNDRGELVVEKEVLRALRTGKLKSYHSDFAPADLNLRRHKRCFCTPHIAATTQTAEDNCGKLIVNSILHFLYDGNIINSKNFPELCVERKGATRVTISSLKPIDVEAIKESLSKFGTVLQGETKTVRDKSVHYAIFDLKQEIPASKIGDLGLSGVKVRVIGVNKKFVERKLAIAQKEGGDSLTGNKTPCKPGEPCKWDVCHTLMAGGFFAAGIGLGFTLSRFFKKK